MANLNILQAFDRPKKLNLNIPGKGGRDAVRINKLAAQALGFKKDIMPRFLGESNDFVFN